MSLFERIKYKRYDLQEKKKFPGDESGAYKQAKDDLEARKGFSKNKSGGLKADEKNPFVKRSVRKTRVDKLGGDIYDQPKFSQKKFDKSLKKFSKGPRTNIVNPFGKGDTPGQQKVKAMDIKAFKVTQPSDIKKTKGFKPFAQLSKDIKDLKKGTRNISSMNPSEMERAFGTSGSTEGAGGANTGTQPQKSKAQKFTDKINKQNKNRAESGSGYSQANKPKPGSEPTVFKPKGVDAKVVDKIPAGSNLNTATKSGTKIKNLSKVTRNLTRKNKGFTEPRKIQKTIPKPSFDISGTKYSKLKGPELPKFVTAKGDASFSKTGAGKGAIRIQKRATRSDVNILRAGQKIARKSGPAKGIVKTGAKILSKLGPKGRLAGLALTGFAASPFGRKTIGTLATAGGLTALFGGGKKEKQLKVGDGLKNVGKVRVTADSKGLKRNQADMAKIKATQKNFIDKYNKGRAFGKIKYNVNKQGTYDVIKPKKK